MSLSFLDCCKFTIIIAAIYSGFVLLKRFLRRRSYRLPPGPLGLPILGQISLFDHLKVFDHRDRYGHVSYLNLFGNDVVLLNSIEAIREAFTGNDTAEIFSHRPRSFMQSDIVYPSIIFGPPSPAWKQLRHKAHTLLKQHGEGIEKLEKVVCGELEFITDLLDENLDKEIDFHIDYIRPFTISVILTLLIGEQLDYKHPLVAAVQRYVDNGVYLANPFIDTLLKTLPFIRFLPIGVGKVVRETLAARDEIISNVFEAQKRLPEAEIETRKGIVFDFIRFQKTENWLDDLKIKGIIIDIISAGVATTSSALQSLFLVIIGNPKVQSMIQSEIDEHVGQDRRPNLFDRQNMPYTQAVVYEILRYAMGPSGVPHSCVTDGEILGFTVPSGSIVIPNFFRVHHDENLWEDPWIFDPQRFLNNSGQLLPASHPVRRSHISFSIGKRACIGEVFAKTRIFLFIVYLLQRFTFVAADDIPPSCDPRDLLGDIVFHFSPYKLIVRSRE